MSIEQQASKIIEMVRPHIIEEYEREKEINDPELKAMREDLTSKLCTFFGLDDQEVDQQLV